MMWVAPGVTAPVVDGGCARTLGGMPSIGTAIMVEAAASAILARLAARFFFNVDFFIV